jgi:hypothetical protein
MSEDELGFYLGLYSPPLQIDLGKGKLIDESTHLNPLQNRHDNGESSHPKAVHNLSTNEKHRKRGSVTPESINCGVFCVFCGVKLESDKIFEKHFRGGPSRCNRIQWKLLGSEIDHLSVQKNPSSYIFAAKLFYVPDTMRFYHTECTICKKRTTFQGMKTHITMDKCIKVRKMLFLLTKRPEESLIYCPYCHEPVHQKDVKAHLTSSLPCQCAFGNKTLLKLF